MHQLSFAKIIKIGDDLIEVFVAEGVEINSEMMDEYHTWIRNTLTSPSYILVNKINAYTYSFDVQRNLSAILEVKAIALVVYSKASELATEAMIELPKVRPWNSQIFHNREDALHWLNSQRDRETNGAS